MALRPSRLAALVVLLGAFCAGRPAAAAGWDAPHAEINEPIPLSTAAVIASTTVVVSSRPVINDIAIHRLNVFDLSVPGEDWWLFRIADRIHVVTKESVVKRELTLAPGDRWDPLKALETERNLRSLNLFRTAQFYPKPRPDGTLDLDLRTQDIWTTIPTFGIGTQGGQNYFSYGFTENNLLGLGKSISVNHTQNGPVISNGVSYLDPRFMGTRLALNPSYSRTNYGDSIATPLTMPFLTLDQEQAGRVSWSRSIGQDIIWQNGTQFNDFLEQSRVVDAGYGRKIGEGDNFVQRAEAGWYSEQDQYNPLSDTLPGTLPANLQLSGPSAGYSWVVPRYIKETYINKMERVEDFDLGNELTTYGGYMGEATGSDRDRWLFNVQDQQGIYFAPGHFALAQAGATGRVADGRFENTLFFTNLNLFLKMDLFYPQTWVVHFEGNKGDHLDLENQVVLGGNDGLRGYKAYSFVGDKSVLLNVEDRIFFPGEYFHLVRFGAAAFLDSGEVSGGGVPITYTGLKSDVGLGLRMASTRSRSGLIVRLDLARALNQGPGRTGWVVALTGGQAFQIFNSSTFRVAQSPASQLIPPPQAQ